MTRRQLLIDCINYAVIIAAFVAAGFLLTWPWWMAGA